MSRFESGAAYGNDLFVHQENKFGTRPVRQAEMNRRIDRIGLEIEKRRPRQKIDGNTRVACDKSGQARHEPACAEAWQHPEIERAAIRIGAQIEGSRRYAPQSFAYFPAITLPCPCQPDRLSLAKEQRHPELFFEGQDLPADGTLGQAELPRSRGNAAGARSGFECRE